MILKNENSRYSVRRSVSLTEELNRDLDLYAEAVDSSPNWVVNQVLSRFFSKDKDFHAWKESRMSLEEKAGSSHPKTPKIKTREKETLQTSS